MFTQVKNVTNKYGKTYYPNKFTKSRPTESVLQKNINLQISQKNYKQASQVYQGFEVSQRRASVH
jgi:predicted XRE-type DNA-binding protein